MLTLARAYPARTLAAALAVTVVVVVVGGAALLSGSSPAPTQSAITSPTEVAVVTPTPSLTPSPTIQPTVSPSATAAGVYAILDGMPTTPELATREPVGVMIDDNVVARPQSGFTSASIVYHAPADGLETRYLLVYQENDAPDVGPVRSTRRYYIKWAAEYRALLGHYGAEYAGQVWLKQIDGDLVYDMDALRGAGSAYHRITTRTAPHNAYTSTGSLYSLAERKGFPMTMGDGLGARLFADDAPLDARPADAFIRVPYKTGRVDYTYDRESNSYVRSVAGKAQLDGDTGERVRARNVIVLFIKLTWEMEWETGHTRPVFHVVGKGDAVVFRDGQAIPGRWVKNSDGDLTRIVDAEGNQIPLVRGPIFVQVVPLGTDVDYG